MYATARQRILEEVAASFPDGRGLPDRSWSARHLGVVVLLGLHAIGLGAFALARGETVGHAFLEAAVIAAIGAVAAFPRLPRRVRSLVGSVGLVASSAVLVHVWEGTIEAHFHFFVMLGVIALYEDWAAYFAAVSFVVLHHGLLGTLAAETVFSHAQGAAEPWVWAVIHATFVLGLTVAILATWRVSDRTRTQLHDSERRFRSVVENAPNYILTVAPDGAIRYINRTVAGLSLAKVVGTSVDGWIHDDDRAQFRAALDDAVRTGTPRSVELRAYGPHGATAWYNMGIGPLAGDGAVTALTIVATDVTEARNAQAERIQHAEREKELAHFRELDRFKTAFINTAAHELGTPLTPIKLQVHMLRRAQDREQPLDRRHALEVLDRNVDRLARLLGDVLEGARLQAGKLRVEKRRVDLADVVEEAAESFRAHASDSHVELRCRTNGRLDTVADPARVSQVLYNLISNALKFTGRGGVVDVEATATDDAVRVTVRDTGAGLRASDIPKLFQPFSQVHDTMQQTRAGTGLGLYISRGIVEEHDGRIWCESAGPGKGAAFHVELPRLPLAVATRGARDVPGAVAASVGN